MADNLWSVFLSCCRYLKSRYGQVHFLRGGEDCGKMAASL